MVLSGVLRATGDARRAMYVTLIGAVVTGIVDPILIFGLHFGVYGAAISTVIARFVFLLVGWYGAVRVAWPRRAAGPHRACRRSPARPRHRHGPPSRPTSRRRWATATCCISSPVSARPPSRPPRSPTGWLPLAFAVLFALSGAVGPILGQNLGAERLDRVRATLSVAFAFTAAYVLVVWFLLHAASPLILALFAPDPEAAGLIVFFLDYGIAAWLFVGLLFVANAAFNNLGFPWLSLVFNWGRATLGTIPFATLGTALGGVRGGQLGIVAGAALFGTAALVTGYVVTGRLAKAKSVST